MIRYIKYLLDKKYYQFLKRALEFKEGTFITQKTITVIKRR